MAAEFGGSMAREEPLVSVVLPTYNRAEYLREAVESVLAQSYEAWELIVVDDGSTDGTRALLSRISDSRVRTIEHEHCGNPARLRNLGIQSARGYYVAFLDSDDWWHPEKLRLQVERLCENARARWSYTRFRLVDQDRKEIPMRAGGPWRAYSGFILPNLVTTEATVSVQTIVAERELLLEVGLFDENLILREDYDLSLRMAAHAEVLAVPEVLCTIRDHPGRSTAKCDDPHGLTARVYLKLRDWTTDSEIRRLADRLCAHHLAEAASWHAASGSSSRAVRALIRAFRYRPFYGRWWVALLKCLLFPMLRIAGVR